MPLTAKGQEILSAMKKTYGSKGEQVFYASANAGTITGVHSDDAELRTLASNIEMPTIRAAGVIFVCDGKALFVQRSANSDHPGEWCFPGGGIEAGESAEEAAKRECREEIGRMPKGDLFLHARRISTGSFDGPLPDGAPAPLPVPPVDFTTFVMKVKEEFEPTLNDEHTGYAWAPINNPPQPMHPGAAQALAKFSMNEYDIAAAIRYGELTSPQEFMKLWLFDMRITGTGMSFRRKHEEFVWRDPSIYLNDGFLARCYGLQVIVEHPKDDTLSDAEFRKRTIGAVMMPYVGDGVRHPADEVWAIVKVHDSAVAKMMLENQLSTSPSVVFRPTDGNTSLEIDGAKILIEGSPSLVDHLAVCWAGVWDKGGEPSGIEVTRGDAEMPDDLAKMMDAFRSDMAKFADSMKDCSTKMDATNKRLDSEKEEREKERNDSKARKDTEEKERADAKAKADADEEEKKKADAAKAAADAAKSDSEKEEEKKKADAAKAKADADEEEKKKADAARADAAFQNSPMFKNLADQMEKMRSQLSTMPGVVSEADRPKFADAQSRADRTYIAHGGRAPAPLMGELLADYERRLVKGMQAHSKTFKEVDLAKISDDAAFVPMRDSIYNDAMFAANNPAVPEGQLIRLVKPGFGGREIHEYAGKPEAWMRDFMAPNRGTSTASIAQYNQRHR